jgi:hypothetical protein
MRDRLQEQKIVFNATGELLKAIKQVAIQLRQYDIWSYREPLKIRLYRTYNVKLLETNAYKFCTARLITLDSLLSYSFCSNR